MPVKVSVIVPVYNTAKYLEKCLNSLVKQTLEDIEIIVVNDGSPDNSQIIIDRFADEYPDKVIALRQENKGLGAARNAGVAHANGEFVGFVDSDDWVETNMYELLCNKAKSENSDVVMCDVCMAEESSGRSEVTKLWTLVPDVPDKVAGYVLASTNPAIACNKIIGHDIVKRIKFPHIWYEDVAAIPVMLSYCKNISIAKEPLYYYLKREGAISTNTNNPKNLDIIKAWERCITDCNKKYTDEMVFAVYFSLCYFLDTKQEYILGFFDFYRRYEDYFVNNKYIAEKIKEKKLVNLSDFAKLDRFKRQ